VGLAFGDDDFTCLSPLFRQPPGVGISRIDLCKVVDLLAQAVGGQTVPDPMDPEGQAGRFCRFFFVWIRREHSS
jgi:hypothetical protein